MTILTKKPLRRSSYWPSALPIALLALACGETADVGSGVVAVSEPPASADQNVVDPVAEPSAGILPNTEIGQPSSSPVPVTAPGAVVAPAPVGGSDGVSPAVPVVPTDPVEAAATPTDAPASTDPMVVPPVPPQMPPAMVAPVAEPVVPMAEPPAGPVEPVPVEPVPVAPVDPWKEAWGQAGGPDGSWRVQGEAATYWSVARNENISYRTKLPSGGQGGIAVYGDRLFLTTFPPYNGGKKFVKKILGHAVDAVSGEILWSVELEGSVEGPMMYGFSDPTSWTPVTDGKHVWFSTPSGQMGAWDMEGNEVWKRDFRVQTGYPFNKQFEPFIVGDILVNMELPKNGEPGNKNWNYLRGLNKLTGETEWFAEDAMTHYSTPVHGYFKGEPVVVFGRGARHNVPERPIGLTMASLAPGKAGKTKWRYAPKGFNAEAMFTNTWDEEHAYWFSVGQNSSHLVLDINDGSLVERQSLQRGVDLRRWNAKAKRYDLERNVNIADIRDNYFKGGVNLYPNWSSNLSVAGYHYFSTQSDNARGKVGGTQTGPSFCVGRVNIKTGKVELLEVPVGVDRRAGRPDAFIYGPKVKSLPEDNQGRDLATEARSRDHGWSGPSFFGTPTAVGDVLYITSMIGVTYVINAKAEVFDEKALISVSDLGQSGETWSLNSISYSRGHLYHRSAKELVCIDPPEKP